MKLILSFIKPPIPIRGFDWICYQDGCDDGLHGYGETPGEALGKWQEYHSEPFIECEAYNNPEKTK